MLNYMNVPASGLLLCLFLYTAPLASGAVAPPPTATLTAAATTLTIALPDADHGYYRGPRFNWGGMVTQVTWNGHTLFTELKQPHNPLLHDHGAGACDEFGIDGALGYDQAAAEGEFLKIGVGALRRISDKGYSFNQPFPVSRSLAVPPITFSKFNGLCRVRRRFV